VDQLSPDPISPGLPAPSSPGPTPPSEPAIGRGFLRRPTIGCAPEKPLGWNRPPCLNVLIASIGQNDRERKMNQKIIDLYDEYTHAPLERRVFLERLAVLTGSVAAAMAALPLLENRAVAAVVAADDPRVTASTVEFPGQGTTMKGYLVKPAGAAKSGAVVVIHENRGLNAHTEDVARRIAVGGFLALAVDFLSPLGGTPTNEDQAREMIGKLDAANTTANAVAAVAYLRGHPDGNGKVGAVGFCWGGGQVNQLAVADPTLDAG